MTTKTLLKLEDGILLKQYSLPWREDGFSAPPVGWYPADMPDIVAMSEKLLAEILESEGPEGLTQLAMQKARLKSWQTFEQIHNDRREMWLGWVPIVFQHDRQIGKAYRRLFVELNGGKRPARQSTHVKHIEDGMYELRNNRMVSLEADNESDA